MYPVTNAVKALFDAEQRKVLRITGTDRNGVTISITDENVKANGFSVDRFSCAGEKLEIGTAIAAEMDLTLYNTNGEFDSIVFEGAELFVEIGIADWSLTTPTITYIPIGYFTPDKQPRALSVITIKALDRMTKFDKYVDSSALSFPATIANLVGQVCTICGVTLATTLTTLPNYDYSVSALPDIQQDITYRTLIQWCAGIMGTCAFIDWSGQLQFKWYSAASYSCVLTNRFTSDLHENDISITGVQYTNTQGVTVVSGTADYALDLTGNYLAAAGIATILPALNTALNGFTYRPFEASVVAAPYLWPLDIITFTDKDGNDHNCIVTNVNIRLNGFTALAGKGETAQLNSGELPSGVTPEQGLLIEQAKQAAIDDVDASLTQQDIFNRLTDNGTAQGLYMVGDQLYVNMTYARSGTLALGGAGDVNGLLQVYDANGNVIVTLDNNGAQIDSGTIISYSSDRQQRIYIDSGVIKVQYMGIDPGTGDPAWVDLLSLKKSTGTNSSSLYSNGPLYISATRTIKINNRGASFPNGGWIEIGDGTLTISGNNGSITIDANGITIDGDLDFTNPSLALSNLGGFAAANVYNGLDKTVDGYALDARQGGIIANVAELYSPPAGASISTMADYLALLDSVITGNGVLSVYVPYTLATTILGLNNSCTGTLLANTIDNRTLTLYCVDNSRIYVLSKQNGTWRAAFKSVALT